MNSEAEGQLLLLYQPASTIGMGLRPSIWSASPSLGSTNGQSFKLEVRRHERHPSAMRNDICISQVADAVDQIASAIERLKSVGVIRSRKFYEDLAEWLVAQLLCGTLASSKIQQHWDVQCEGHCIQVRSHWKAVDNPNRWSNTKGTYDALVIVVFNQALRVSEMYRVPFIDVATLRSADGRLRWDVLSDFRLHPNGLAIPESLRPLFA